MRKQWVLFLLVLGISIPAIGDTFYWGTTENGTWDVESNWNGGVKPGAGDYVYFLYPFTSGTINTPEQCFWLCMGSSGSDEAILYVNSGSDLTMDTMILSMGDAYNKGAINQSGGILTINNQIYLGYSSADYSGYGKYLLSDGILNTKTVYLGCYGQGIFEQTGGIHNTDWLSVGYYNYPITAPGGTYSLTGGTLTASTGVVIAQLGRAGTFYFGDVQGTGTIEENGVAAYLDNRTQGLFVGYGQVGFTGLLTNNGKVIADAYGRSSQDSLDMSRFGSVANTTNNTVGGAAGWYARNKGELILPKLSVAAGTNDYLWGESGTTLDLVNSVKMAFTGVNGGGLSVSLLASDRSELAGTSGNILGAWKFSSSNFDFGSGSAQLSFRYDDILAQTMGLTEGDLRVYQQSVDGKWVDVTESVDTTNKLITTKGVNSFSVFVVGTQVAQIFPEPTFTPSGPYISGPTEITINSATTRASIYYTLNGGTPTTSSTFYAPGSTVTVNPGDILKAIAVADGYGNSNVNTVRYDIQTIPIVAWGGIPGSPFITMERFQEMHDAGFTHQIGGYYSVDETQNALDYALVAGIRLFLTKKGPFPLEQFIPQFKNHPALEGYFVIDEPNVAEFDNLRAQVQTIQSMDLNHWCYINLWPDGATSSQLGTSTYQSYVDTYLNTVPVRVLSFDNYPITSGGFTPLFYENLEIISAAARNANMPFWAFARSTSYGDLPIPTLAHLRFQMYSNLAYGAQGLQYFTYWTPDDYDSYVFHDGPIEDGARTATYYVVKEMNQEIKGLSSVFLGAKVLSVGHTGTTLPQDTTRYTTPIAPIKDLTTIGDGAVVSRLINGHVWYLAVVNRDIVNTMTLNLTVDTDRGISKVAKDGSSTAMSSGAVQYTVDPGDIVILKWSAIPGDANMDDTVDVGDLGILAANYGKTSGATWAQGDFNGDGEVDVGDLGILAANYGTGTKAGADFNADYAEVFGFAAEKTDTMSTTDTSSSVCNGLGLPLIAGLVLMGLVLVKLEE